MVQWRDMKEAIRSSLLRDESGTERFTDDDLLTCARWACAELSYHTAPRLVYTFPVDGATQTFKLPPNRFGEFGKYSLITYKSSSTNQQVIIPEYRRYPTHAKNLNIQETTYMWYERPTGYMYTSFIASATDTLEADYFATWPAPTSDIDEMSFPDWMEHAFAYLTAAFAIDPYGAQSSMIRQWNTRIDSGSPEDNTLIRQSTYYVKQAYRILALVQPQDRDNFFMVTQKT